MVDETGPVPYKSSESEITSFYRKLRRSVIEGGIEIDALECVARVCRTLELEIAPEQIAAGVDVLMRQTLSSACPRPGANELVRTLHNAGIRTGIISNAIYQPFLEWALARFGFNDDLDFVLTSAKAGYYKSRVELYEIASDLLQVPARNTIHVGDSLRFDVVGAANAGMRTVWLNLTGEPASIGRPDIVVESLDGLASLLIETFRIGPTPQSGAMRAL